MSAEFLERVMDDKRRQMSLLGEAEREAVRDAAVAARTGREPRFHNKLLSRPTAIIAEFKRHSPSAGDIQAGADPVPFARLYEGGGAAAISVLTEPEHFHGSLDDLCRVASAVKLPLLRKDFVVDRHQVYEAATAGAEAVLVIIAGLTDAQALNLLDTAHLVHLDALLEVHTIEEMRRASTLGGRLIGVNNRNLKTLKVDLETSLRMVELAPADATLVAESGLRTRADITRLQSAGYRAFLIGETLMRAAEPLSALAELQGLAPGQRSAAPYPPGSAGVEVMGPVEIKICGITRVEDALSAMELGADMLGLNFYSASPRCITLPQAQQIARAVGGVRDRGTGRLTIPEKSQRVRLVGVFVNMNVLEVLRIARAVPLDAVQLHGDESRADCEILAAEFPVIRALKVDAEFSAARAAEFVGCHALLMDTPSPVRGGSGECFSWDGVAWESLRRAFPAAKLILAGGLHEGNVARAIAIAHPAAVDVCSGVESAKGIKSFKKLRDFVAAVRAAERQER